jgi:hypothetical protein
MSQGVQEPPFPCLCACATPPVFRTRGQTVIPWRG